MWWHGDSVTAYPYYLPIFIVVFFLAGNGGFLLGYWLVKNGHVVVNRIVYITIFIYSAAWIFGQIDRTFHLGSYAEWKSGTALWFYQDRTFLFMLIFTLVVWRVALLIFFFKLRREGRHLDTW